MIDLSKLIAEAHLNSVRHGFWGVWKGGLCLLCDKRQVTAERPPTCPECGAKDDPTQRDIATKIALIHSELSEALEEFRLKPEKRGGELNEILFECNRNTPVGLPRRVKSPEHNQLGMHSEGPQCDSREHKPTGFLVELADVAIRLFDLAGWFGKSLGYGVDLTGELRGEGETGVFVGAETTDTLRPESSVPHFIAELHHVIGGAYGVLVPHPQDINGGFLGLNDAFGLLFELAKKVGGNLEQAIEIKMAYNATRPLMHGKTC